MHTPTVYRRRVVSGQFSRRRLLSGAAVLGLGAAATLAMTASRSGDAGPQATTSPTRSQKPQVETLSQSTGSVQGGEPVTLLGSGLQEVTAVTFGSRAATGLRVLDTDRIEVTVPAAYDFLPAQVQVAVSSPAGRSTAATSYDYQALTPVDAQLVYAFTYWQHYNTTAYGDFNPMGGDCVNFVSQTLHARGWPMTDQWYNRDGGSDYSTEWVYVPHFDEWVAANQAALGVRRLTLEQRDEVKVGDIVIFEWENDDSLDHAQIVSELEPSSDGTRIRMVGHNIDTRWRDLDIAITVEKPGATAHFWSVS